MIAPVLSRQDDIGMAEAFGRDGMLEAKVRALVLLHKIKTVVETGAWRGYTTRRFSEFVENVVTIEIDNDYFRQTSETLGGRKNACAIRGNSAEVMPKLLPRLDKPILYYLDAHWLDAWPLFDELEAIANDKAPSVIVVHDIKVPDTNLGYDSYGGTPLTFELIKPILDKLQFKWRHEFNDDSAQGHKRGALFVTPCES